MRAAIFGVWAAIAACGSGAQAQAVDDRKAPQATSVREATVRSGVSAAHKNDCDTARKTLDPALAEEGAASLPPALLAAAYEAAAACAYNTNDMDAAYRFAMRGTEKGPGSDILWNIRLGFESNKLPDAAVATIEEMAQRAPKVLAGTKLRWMYFFDRTLKNEKKDVLRRRLLRVLTSPNYAPDEPLATRDGFFQGYAELLFAEGDKAGAAAMVRQITDVSILLELSFDARFRAMLPADLDLRAAAVRVRDRAQAARGEHPELLNPILIVATQQRMLGDAQGALATLESARKVVAAPDAYADSEEQLNWWWDGMSRTYAMLGRQAEAEAALRSGSGAEENGGLNVSQLINLAQLQLASSPKAAIATLAPFTNNKMPVSPYGEAEMRFARGCASALAGDRAAAASDLAFIQAREADHPEALTRLLLCMGEMDRAAAAVVRRLDDPERRARALILLSEFDPPLAAAPVDPVDSRLPALRARPDIQAAIARAGGTRRIHLQGVER